MPNASQFARSAVIAAAVMTLGASPAMARPADHPAHYRPAVIAVVQHAQPWTQPRVDATGVRPGYRPAPPDAPAVPLTRAADSSGGADWLLITLAALTLFTLLMIGGVVRHRWHRTDSFHARQV
jgi:hypothetical protein